jgi:hypothetical protein
MVVAIRRAEEHEDDTVALWESSARAYLMTVAAA